MSYADYVNRLSKLADIAYTGAVLNWDMETYMPPKSAERRSQQLATLSGLAHEQFTSEETGILLNKLSQDESLDERQKANVKHTLKQYGKAKKYTTSFVEEMSRTISETFNAWQEASTTTSIIVDACVGVIENVSTPFTMFPNPSNGSVTLNLNYSNSLVEVVDVLGNTVSTPRYSNAGQVQLNMNDAAEGIYFVRVTSGNEKSVQKLIIRR